jgi:hypothetical protein
VVVDLRRGRKREERGRQRARRKGERRQEGSGGGGDKRDGEDERYPGDERVSRGGGSGRGDADLSRGSTALHNFFGSVTFE